MSKVRIPQPGEIVSHYTILNELGKGGMGLVFKARDEQLDRLVALKFLPLQYIDDKVAKKRFVNEAKSASALDHPNICPVHEIGETADGLMFIVMGYCGGESGLEWLKRHENPSIPDTVAVVRQIAEGLAAAHRAGIVHRDIKPGNIMFTGDGRVKIVDFGIAKLLGGSRITATGLTPGTLDFMSPEQSRGDDVDARSDIFSVGTLFYVFVTGTMPFAGDHVTAVTYKIQHVDPPPPHELRRGVPVAVSNVISKAMQKRPKHRYQSMPEFLVDLQQLIAPEARDEQRHARSGGNARSGVLGSVLRRLRRRPPPFGSDS